MLDYKDVLLRHNKSIAKSRRDCDTSQILGNKTFAVPVVAANMKSIITPEICQTFDKNNWFYVYHRIGGVDDVSQFVRYSQGILNVISISVGVTKEWINLIAELWASKAQVDYFTIDVALSYNDNVLPILDQIKDFYPDSYVIMGNGATAEWAEWCSKLRSDGLLDAIKLGIGVSQSCLTRQYTGFGSTTLGSLRECRKAADPELVIISDGGLTVQNERVWLGDIAKALIFGADFVMTGAAFARCSDSPSATTGYAGNASQHSKGNTWHVEGDIVKVETNDINIKQMMYLIQDSLRSSISYSGGLNIKEMKERAEWELINE